MSVYDYKVKGLSKRFFNVMYSITELKKKLFVPTV